MPVSDVRNSNQGKRNTSSYFLISYIFQKVTIKDEAKAVEKPKPKPKPAADKKADPKAEMAPMTSCEIKDNLYNVGQIMNVSIGICG